mgnify:CR=1 FL=1
MFLKIVIVLLLLIVAASLLGGRGAGRAAIRPKSQVRPLMLRIAIILLILGAGVIVVHLSGCSRSEDGFHATDVSGANFGRLAALDGLTDHLGRRLASADFSGKAVVVFFGYTRCPDICPTTLSAMQAAMKLLGPDADRVQVLFVTVDPERDTPAVLKDYVPWFDARFIGLHGDPAVIRDLAREFHVFFHKVEGETAMGYSIDHTATSYAYDPAGRLRLLIPHGAKPEHIAADLRALLAGS